MVIHGGTQGKGVFLNDTHELDLDTLTWHRVEISGLEGIRGRAFASSVSSKGNVLVFGGTTLSPDEPPLGELIELRKQRAVDMEDIPAELAMLIFGAATLRCGRPGEDRGGVSEVEAVEHGRKSLG
jgi:hypothetical protein